MRVYFWLLYSAHGKPTEKIAEDRMLVSCCMQSCSFLKLALRVDAHVRLSGVQRCKGP